MDRFVLHLFCEIVNNTDNKIASKQLCHIIRILQLYCHLLETLINAQTAINEY